ncbi:MAG TPA: hypothetical protein PLQ00_09125, partial [Thermoguttaceae bacterium]|nr:hypothetical protein [Thermoguttaceae bacterium]
MNPSPRYAVRWLTLGLVSGLLGWLGWTAWSANFSGPTAENQSPAAAPFAQDVQAAPASGALQAPQADPTAAVAKPSA